MNLEVCSDCLWPYPDYILGLAFANGEYTKPICGICALSLSNRITGVHRSKFQGELAEWNRQAAIRFRVQNPDKDPLKAKP